ncbi:MAG: molybdopterin molybdotransferase MoeA [Planctomycetota bacterium]|jgi:molybdopterin molybdotransferase
MIPVDEARALVSQHARLLEPEDVALRDAHGRFLAASVHADRDDPPFSKSLMDGYAIRAADAPGTLKLVGRIEAGQVELVGVGPGEGVWINTGAPLPPGADCVVPVEWTVGEIEVDRTMKAGQNVLPQGTLVATGDELCSGRLGPEEIAVCASAGVEPVIAIRRPRIAVLATGSEFHPGPHSIRNSNGPLLVALLQSFAEVVDLGEVDDEFDALKAKLERGLACDAVVTTGGVSMGDRDLVRPALEELGCEVLVHGISLQPGKPFLFAQRDGAYAFGLPGNPASALVCADLFVVPWGMARQGADFHAVPATRRGVLAAAVQASAKRRRVFPCRLDDGRIDPLPWRSSADLYTLTRANAYMVVEAGRDLDAGEVVSCLVPERLAR